MTDVNPINPYQAPASSTVPPTGSGLGELRPALPWVPTEAIGFGWKLMTRQPMCILVFFVSMLVGNLISGVGAIINAVMSQSNDENVRLTGLGIYVGAALVNLPISLWIQMGLVRYSLAMVRGKPGAGFGEVFTGGPFFTFVGAALLVGLSVGLGMLLCIVPGVILALGWLMFSYLIIDRRLGAIESLSTSWRIATGHKGNLFLLMLLVILVSLAGYLACIVGIFAALPVIQFAIVYVYLKLTGEEPPVLQ